MIEEVWKEIPQYAGYYEASNLGRIRVLDRVVIRINKGEEQSYVKKGHILTPQKEGSNYWQVSITYPVDKKRQMKVHRLVAFAFIPNTQKKKCINHKDGNKANNCLSNLEWATHRENLTHAHQTGLKRPPSLGKFGSLHHRSKPVISTKETVIIEHGSVAEAGRYFNVRPSAIRQAIINEGLCKGNRIYFA